MDYNRRNPAVKRLMKEAEELRNPTEEFEAYPIQDNLFEWHFTIIGPSNTDFSGGIYHGRILLPPDYPMKPPSIMLLTPNGRFEINKKICLSISGHHPESWQPSWSIRTALLAIIGFMPTYGNGAIGSLDYTPEERQKLAKRSQSWKCPECGFINRLSEKREHLNPSSTTTNSCQAVEKDSSLSLSEEQEEEMSCNHDEYLRKCIHEPEAMDKQDSTNSQENNQKETTGPRFRNQSSIRNGGQNDLSDSHRNIEPTSNSTKCFSWMCVWAILLPLTVLLFRRLFYQ